MGPDPWRPHSKWNSAAVLRETAARTCSTGTDLRRAISARETWMFLGSLRVLFTGARAGESLSSTKLSRGRRCKILLHWKEVALFDTFKSNRGLQTSSKIYFDLPTKPFHQMHEVTLVWLALHVVLLWRVSLRFVSAHSDKFFNSWMSLTEKFCESQWNALDLPEANRTLLQVGFAGERPLAVYLCRLLSSQSKEKNPAPPSIISGEIKLACAQTLNVQRQMNRTSPIQQRSLWRVSINSQTLFRSVSGSLDSINYCHSALSFRFTSHVLQNKVHK